MKRIITIILSCFMFFTLVGCGNNSSTTNSNINYNSGEEITLAEDAPCCSSKSNVDKMIDYVRENNKNAQDRMLSNGEAKVIPKGSKVTIVSLGIVVEIETEDGESWFAPCESIVKE
ncbi:hypothetical protein [Clostridium sp. KNHs214]|uniref:hypothetical protein n=1 Tax=Clostridium sp. KNHs214 TaxID=1540257 RepID=UPI00054F9D4D|nr:hypothetical protein [Clostridium sp. KNHs214]